MTAPAPPPTCAPAADRVTDTASTASWRGVTDAKKLSVLRRKLSLLLTPSSVMLEKALGQAVDRRIPVGAGRVDARQETRPRSARFWLASACGEADPNSTWPRPFRSGCSRAPSCSSPRSSLRLADFQRERNGDRLAGRDADALRRGGLEAGQRRRHRVGPGSKGRGLVSPFRVGRHFL